MDHTKDITKEKTKNQNGKQSGHPTQKSQKRFKDFMEGLFVALIAALIIRQFIVQAYTIPTSSMEKTLLVGDFLLVNKFVYGMQTPDWLGIPYTRIGVQIPWEYVYRFPGVKDPEPYDVFIFRYPEDPYVDYIKRCVAVPGQTVEIINKKLYVDSLAFPKPPNMQYLYPKQIIPRNYKGEPHPRFKNLGSRDNYGPLTLPEKSYWAMGDNRDNSLDSRYWGFVPYSHIVGQALIIYFSVESEFPFVRGGRIGQVIR